MSYYCSNTVRTKKFIKWNWYVYVIECQDGFYYTGMTFNTNIRFEQHKSGLGSKFTKKHGFKEVKYVEEFDDITNAREREKQVKDFSRKKKELLWRSDEFSLRSNDIDDNIYNKARMLRT